MKTIAVIIGAVAVAFYMLGYLQKRRKNILLFNMTSRTLYIIQYVMLGAFEGAVLDVAGMASSLLANNKHKGVVKKYNKLFFIASGLLMIAMGLVTYKNLYSLLPLAGALLQVGALWCDNEKIIRLVSFAGAPCWLVYNFVSGAYGSCVGDVITICCLIVAVIRYDILKK